jgi:hypothetical protein
MYPYLRSTFYYPPLTDNVHYMTVVPDQPQDENFQILSFHTMYFHYLWILPSPYTMMEGTEYHGMDMPLSMTEFSYSIIQRASTDLDPILSQELDAVLEPIWAQGSLFDTDSLNLFFPLNEVIIEEMTSRDRPWDDLHHRSYFLPELR